MVEVVVVVVAAEEALVTSPSEHCLSAGRLRAPQRCAWRQRGPPGHRRGIPVPIEIQSVIQYPIKHGRLAFQTFLAYINEARPCQQTKWAKGDSNKHGSVWGGILRIRNMTIIYWGSMGPSFLESPTKRSYRDSCRVLLPAASASAGPVGQGYCGLAVAWQAWTFRIRLNPNTPKPQTSRAANP